MRTVVLALTSAMLVLSATCVPANAFWIWTPETGRWINPKYAVKDTPQKQLDYALEIYKAGSLDKAHDEFVKLIKHYPKSRQAPDARFYIGKIYEDQGRFGDAFHSYQEVIDKYPFSDLAGRIVKIEFDLGNKMMEGRGRKAGILQNISGSEVTPADVFKAVIKNVPYGPYAPEAQYRIGLYFKGKALYQQARDAFEKVADNYPASKWAKAARYQIAMSDAKRSAKAQYNQSVTKAAIEQFKQFTKEYPDAQLSRQARGEISRLQQKEAHNRFIIARFYEKNRKYRAARIYYQMIVQNYANTSWASKALERLQSMDSEKKK